uniref:Uncharacterized protein n=1 Tax=Avena sativa TaxID=4498 RepID=A0ACD5ZC57_AVESA
MLPENNFIFLLELLIIGSPSLSPAARPRPAIPRRSCSAAVVLLLPRCRPSYTIGPHPQVVLYAMARRKVHQAVIEHKGKGARKKRNVFSEDQNRASPAPIIKLYKSLSESQRNLIVYMGHGSLLDIKCENLHNPVVYWFAKGYDPGRRAFVIPCRGTIPLTEESIHVMTGLPHRSKGVKYYVDYDLKVEIGGRLFPNSRPKISEIGSKIAKHTTADLTFQLWLLFITSTVVAPTTDTRMSNTCYPMLGDAEQAHELNMCKFIVDELHKNLSAGSIQMGACCIARLPKYSRVTRSAREDKGNHIPLVIPFVR